MPTFTLVTGNHNKLKEWQRLVPPDFILDAVDIDLEEIQSLDLEEIVCDKVRRAYEVVGKPVIVEDVAAGLDELGGLPGPFIKFFEMSLGQDALFRLAGTAGAPATVHSSVAYYDGVELVTAVAAVKGWVVPARGKSGFGFDVCFVPAAGNNKTFAEMTPAQKDSLSHRSRAVRLLMQKLS